MLKISKVKVYPFKNRSRTGAIGVGQVTFDGGLLLSGLELVERNNKRFITYPVNPLNNHGLCYCQPINSILSENISTALFNEYDAQIATRNGDENSFFNNAAEDMLNQLKNEVSEAEQVLLKEAEHVQQQNDVIGYANCVSAVGVSEGPESSDEELEIISDNTEE